ncbi:hypothetical protein [Leuconostoc mesenteroides]|uniref:hypothetical protein n=1 Tax=Leuconostoc mesenteroides TaxID=1245 RepID=UPI000778796E|nr:hypothetical protein [Leuconostoc mesenteroides]MCT8391494.1 hypothetical protein [Leuconostoc mesenteroides]
MTFDEVLDEMNANQEPSESIRFMEQLRDIYAPTVEMNQKQYSQLMWYKRNANLFTCIDCFLKHDGTTKFVLSSENLLGNLTQEDIAQAWLHPETIKIVDE